MKHDMETAVDMELIDAAFDMDMEKSLRALEKGASTLFQDDLGWTALSYASSNGWVEGMRLLIENGADVDKPNDNGDPPVLLAAGGLHVEAVVELALAGADAACMNNKADTLFDLSMYEPDGDEFLSCLVGALNDRTTMYWEKMRAGTEDAKLAGEIERLANALSPLLSGDIDLERLPATRSAVERWNTDVVALPAIYGEEACFDGGVPPL